jgi:hypothetical protein
MPGIRFGELFAKSILVRITKLTESLLLMTYNITAFAEKVRVMNQSNSKSLTLKAEEARNLESDILELLAKSFELSTKIIESTLIQSQTPSNIEVDGGTF